MPQLTIQQAFDLALRHHQAGQLPEAEQIYRDILAQHPENAMAIHGLGVIALHVNRYDVAAGLFRRTITLQPGFAAAHSNLGYALRYTGQIDQAIDACRRAIALKSDYPQAHFNLGNALYDMGNLDEAIAAYRQAIALRTDYPEAHYNLGHPLTDTGQVEQGIEAYRQAIALRPDFAEAHDNLLYTLHFHPAYDAQAIGEELRLWNRKHARPLGAFIEEHPNDRAPERRLRLGYVSPYFYSQAESYFALPLLAAHDHEHFEIHLYSSVRTADAATELHRRCADRWHDVGSLGDHDLAAQVRRDGIDILIDLAMHMSGSRLLMFARKPAPVQVTWLAYPGGTGLETMDYRLTDRFLDPPESDGSHYVEKSIRLPDWWACYAPRSGAAPAAPRPLDWKEPIRFGSLNNPCKMNEPTIRLWARVLRGVADSRLLLLADSAGHRENLARQLAEAGIEGSRLKFVGHRRREEYLRTHDDIDIGLDPLPYNGITTTLDALWMGVPVVSLAGRTAAGRAGLGILTTLGLPELATRSDDDFVAAAVALAHDRARQRQLRRMLRGMMEQSPLMDGPRFARNVEAAYRQMWRAWCEAGPDGASRASKTPSK